MIARGSHGRRRPQVKFPAFNWAMVMRNPGLHVCGEAVPEVIWIMHSLQEACAAQVAALAGRTKLTLLPEEIAPPAPDASGARGGAAAAAGWPWMLRLPGPHESILPLGGRVGRGPAPTPPKGKCASPL